MMLLMTVAGEAGPGWRTGGAAFHQALSQEEKRD